MTGEPFIILGAGRTDDMCKTPVPEPIEFITCGAVSLARLAQPCAQGLTNTEHHNHVVSCARRGVFLPALRGQMATDEESKTFLRTQNQRLLDALVAADDKIEIAFHFENGQAANRQPKNATAKRGCLRTRAAEIRDMQSTMLTRETISNHLRQSFVSAPPQLKFQAARHTSATGATLVDRRYASDVARALEALFITYQEKRNRARAAYTLLGPLPPYSFHALQLGDAP